MFEFIPAAPTLAAYAIAVVILAATPGPDLTLFLGQTVANGRRAGFAALAGTCTGLLGHSAIAALGLSALLAASPQTFLALKWIGAAYLAWLAWEALRHGSGISRERGSERHTLVSRAYMRGLMINLLNPKIILFFVTFLPQFVSPADPHAGGKLFFLGICYIAVSVPVILPFLFAAERVSAWLSGSRRATRMLDYAVAGVMGGFAAKLLLAQAK
ncbi:MAG: LysE family translocator [Rhodobiaceae bacterium]|nr:LysE family translocator [Rhodobiaceae bacterium]MCC0041239.1 LysE family translocator [Rhodobiaceae bacterium]